MLSEFARTNDCEERWRPQLLEESMSSYQGGCLFMIMCGPWQRTTLWTRKDCRHWGRSSRILTELQPRESLSWRQCFDSLFLCLSNTNPRTSRSDRFSDKHLITSVWQTIDFLSWNGFSRSLRFDFSILPFYDTLRLKIKGNGSHNSLCRTRILI